MMRPAPDAPVIVGAAVVAAGFPAHDPVEVLGKRGLRYKDEATRLGLAGVYTAFRDAGIDDCSDAVTAVIVSSNYGNLDTVCRIVGDGVDSGERGPMDLPNASSNVIASSIAIRFGLFGPNLMLCSGANSGLDAVDWATVLLGSGRAARVVVVGVEVDNAAVRRFATARIPSGLFHGAGCIVVERADLATSPPHAVVGKCVRGPEVSASVAATPVNRWYTPDFGTPAELVPVVHAEEVVDLAERIGAASGALGIVQAVLAATGHGRSLLTTGGDGTPLTACLITSNSPTTFGE
ncbi:beta-ketoacyl synthase N-terminal-like domain-containing protein [Nocardia sp. NPDC005998]|uniref:beta-ketoacyl synthase N-terminal-like domain-containing protein n=1 Tax=Nocardia sp. NPDC005998 TaxID=3156894 RepID=UPI0033B242BE